MQLWQPAIPDRYTTMGDDALDAAIQARRAELGSELVILGHHYQQDSVIQFADFTGDSFKLSQLAAEKVAEVGAKYVVFCGVHFMAETADILTPAGTAVILPDLGAGCSMADMADYDQTVEAWEAIHESLDQAVPSGDEITGAVRVIPVCYMNSSAAIKAFCGEHGGAVCTSSNCDKVFDWALAGGDAPRSAGGSAAATGGRPERVKILFLPDQHLGRNTAAAAGFDPVTQTCVWDPRDPDGQGGCEPEELTRSTFILWKGHCSVHKLFRPEHVDQVRADWPDVTVMAHPECAYEVCQKADLTGSTEGIIRALEDAAPGSRWAIATEVHLVKRLCDAAAERGVTARILSDCQCLCTTMYRIDRPHLLWVLDHLAEGKVINQITVHPEAQRLAMLSLNRMLEITAAPTRESEARIPLVD